MSCWRKATCNNLRILVRRWKLRCAVCYGKHQLEDPAAVNGIASTTTQPPPNEHFGRVNLWWPPSVPYNKYEQLCIAARRCELDLYGDRYTFNNFTSESCHRDTKSLVDIPKRFAR